MSDMSVPRIKDEDHYKCRKLKRQRDMLLEALKKIEQVEAGVVTTSYDMRRIARAAIATVEESE